MTDPDGPDRTWARLTLIHEGSASRERYRLESCRPVAGPRPCLGAADDRGAYRWVLRSMSGRSGPPAAGPASGANDCLASLGYSPLFAEWQATLSPSDRNQQAFLECLYCPLPAGPSRLLIEKRLPSGGYETLLAVPLDPMRDPVQDGFQPKPPGAGKGGIAIHTIGDAGPAGDRVNLLLIGDGYGPGEGDRFLAAASRFEAALFAVEPYRRRRSDFNLYAVHPPAPAASIAGPAPGQGPDSPLGSSYGTLGIDRYLLPRRLDRLYALCDRAPCDQAVVLCNAEKFGGGGLFNQFCCVAAQASDFAYLVRHEFGHAFAGLADEYYTAMVTYRQSADAVAYWEPNVSHSTPAGAVKWSHWIAPEVPVPTPWRKGDFEELMRRHEALRAAAGEGAADAKEGAAEARQEMEQLRIAAARLLGQEAYAGRVGAFEGAAYRSRGVFRPEVDCLMFSRTCERFCGVCEAAIEATIDGYLALRRDRR